MSGWTDVDYDVALEVASHEAVVRQTYKDSVGVLTWSVGLTDATGHDVSRYVRNPASMQKCMDVYVWALNNYADAVRETFRGYKLTKAQFAAALSFHWNTGAIRRAKWVKSFKRGNMVAARKEFMNWTTPKEITKRREKERDLFFDGKWSNKGMMLEYTKVHSNLTPNWSSGKMRDVTLELKLAFDVAHTIKEDKPKQPDAPVNQPTVSNPHSFWLELVTAVLGLFK